MLFEQQTIKKAQNGDRAAMERLYRAHFNNLYAYVRHQIDTIADCEDICANSFTKAFASLNKFKGNSSFKTWLFAIARNQVIDHYRRAKPVEIEITELAEPEQLETNENLETEVKQILSKLPARDRQVLELRFLGNCSTQETAEIMKASVTNVKVWQHRALKKALSATRQEKPV